MRQDDCLIQQSRRLSGAGRWRPYSAQAANVSCFGRPVRPTPKAARPRAA